MDYAEEDRASPERNLISASSSITRHDQVTTSSKLDSLGSSPTLIIVNLRNICKTN